MVQQPGEAVVDAGTGDHRADLADSLPDHRRHVRLRVRAGDSEEDRLDGRVAVRHQPRGEPDLHADSVRDAEPAAGSGGHPDRLGHDHLDDRGDLEALPMGGRGPGAVLRLGVDCDRPATVDHLDELETLS